MIHRPLTGMKKGGKNTKYYILYCVANHARAIFTSDVVRFKAAGFFHFLICRVYKASVGKRIPILFSLAYFVIILVFFVLNFIFSKTLASFLRSSSSSSFRIYFRLHLLTFYCIRVLSQLLQHNCLMQICIHRVQV